MNQSKRTQICFISVCRDFELYKKFFEDNSNTNSYVLNQIDNRQENLGIPKRYNQFLDQYNYLQETWFVFCHEDFLLQDTKLKSKLEHLDKGCFWGPIGSALEYKELNFARLKTLMPQRRLLGNILQKDKDGSNSLSIGKLIDSASEVSTFDCCCLIVHSSLIQKHSLRFDEKLTFDLYVEDFCANGLLEHKIKSFALQIDCEHWSYGNIGPRYLQSLEYLNQKYSGNLFAGSCSFIGRKREHNCKTVFPLLVWLDQNKLNKFVFPIYKFLKTIRKKL
jgi:hypothetical protein